MNPAVTVRRPCAVSCAAEGRSREAVFCAAKGRGRAPFSPAGFSRFLLVAPWQRHPCFCSFLSFLGCSRTRGRSACQRSGEVFSPCTLPFKPQSRAPLSSLVLALCPPRALRSRQRFPLFRLWSRGAQASMGRQRCPVLLSTQQEERRGGAKEWVGIKNGRKRKGEQQWQREREDTIKARRCSRVGRGGKNGREAKARQMRGR